jgi:glycosyltransferase involved in cell wall biosynthesis
MDTELILVYLGRRGGGAHLLADLAIHLPNYLPKKIINVIISKKSEVYISRTNSITVTQCLVPHSHGDLLRDFNFLRIPLSLFSVFSQLNKIQSATVIQIMPSPFDVFFDYYAKRRGFKIIRLIHELKHHEGDSWPTERAVLNRVRSANVIVVFSSYVKNEIAKYTDKTVIRSGLNVKIYSNESSLNMRASSLFDENKDKTKFLFIGRFREYKGINFLLDAFLDLTRNSVLVVAGEGNLRVNNQSNNIELINRWLSDDEFNNLINDCDVLVLPYNSASQSGIIPIAINHNKKILVSNVGGLSEQISGYQNGFTFKVGDPVSFKEMIKRIENSFYEGNHMNNPRGREMESNSSDLAADLRDILIDFD